MTTGNETTETPTVAIPQSLLVALASEEVLKRTSPSTERKGYFEALQDRFEKNPNAGFDSLYP